MIIEFSVKNFRSFRSLTTLSLEAAPLKTHETSLIHDEPKVKLLPTVGIFGHNASGKSNLVKALAYMQWAMLNSDYLNQPTNKHPFLQPFLLNSQSSQEPSFFQVVLWDSENKVEYRYGFEISLDGVLSEWLETTSKVNVQRRKKSIFIRKGTEYKFDDSVRIIVRHLTTNVRPNALALTVFAQFADPISSQVIKLMSAPDFMILDSTRDLLPYALQQYYENPKLASKVLKLLKKFDLGLQDLKVIKEPFTDVHLNVIPTPFKPLFNQTHEVFRAVSSHIIYGDKKNGIAEFDFMNQESLGTRSLFVLLILVVQILEKGGIFVIDEFGANLHPFMSKEILTLFQNHDSNPNGAQLIFCSHETYLLSKHVDLRQDQFYFAEKNSKEETELQPLIEYNVRSDFEFEKNYLQGRFGAVPIVKS